MELPGLTKAIYGITKTEAIRAGICIDCKKDAKWYSPAGKQEYFISGLCEYCFDKITAEPEDLMIKQLGSDVEGVLNNDHAQAAQKYLDDNGFAKDWQVVVADDTKLMLDYDQTPYNATLPEQFYTTLGILEDSLGQTVSFDVFASKGGNTHVVLTFVGYSMSTVERIAWQAAFGSDPKREALHLLSVSRGELNPILLFMRKEQKLLGDGNVNA
jgi:hypothetical protein